ncbi:hypothetical protein C7N43_35365 [Sphingobacteriales bacterium UPWRP_1]|nr:hypothetical protein BVG80_00650 [Sphingobacteriales bacterium TSM_CSM]PSJ72215.1 hypothetical protein C7N43_35365 [Sphingobacteriales bacterium UPWRP_1]
MVILRNKCGKNAFTIEKWQEILLFVPLWQQQIYRPAGCFFVQGTKGHNRGFIITILQKPLLKGMKNISLFAVFLGLIALLYSLPLFATHNRAGEISFVSAPLPGQPYRYIFTVTTYTKISGGGASNADRDTLDVSFGDGTAGKAPRINGGGNGVPIGNNIKHNIYQITHSYPAPFNYVVSMQDPNRIDEIINIQLGNSVDVPFYIEDTIFFRDPQFFGFNSSPILLQPPIDFANVGYTFVHNPNAFDPDGDSLHFELIPPKQDPFNDVPLYQSPTEIQPGPNNNLSLNPVTGELIWNSPQRAGIYNIAILITEFRNGVKMGTMVRDMQVIVEDKPNRPPVIPPINDTCIVVGETLQFNIAATDADVPAQLITLTGYGGPFEADVSPAQLIATSGLGFASGTFTWQTTCDHIYSQAYTVVIKAEDNFTSSGVPLPLADLETWLITIAPPPPQNLTAQASGNNIILNWDFYQCQNSPKFRGFSVWRSIGCDSLVFDRCTLGLGGTTYQKLAEGITANTYTDATAVKGVVYSYRMVAEFADAFTNSNPPNPLNVVSSIASANACAELPKNAPIITNVSIDQTQTANGQIFIAWTKPLAQALDTIANPPPYRYELYRLQGFSGTNYTLVQTWSYNSFAEANDTTYTNLAPELNTAGNPYAYKVAFFSNNQPVDESETASSVFLTATPSDNQLQLDWNFNVPWLNTHYNVYRQNNAGDFSLLATATTPTYTDAQLQNGKEYCYYIEAFGTYANPTLPNPLINLSQRVCGVPKDTVAPCAPTLAVSNYCTSGENTAPDVLSNLLEWTNNNSASCDNDITGYNIYYASPLSAEYQLIATVTDAQQTVYEHILNNSLAGCYTVAAIDSFSNQSPQSNIVCVKNCVEFELPNVFTPNADGDNELFVPRKSRFVSSIDMKIYNRWGQLVFETNNPNIEWNGTDQSSGKNLAEGVYYYTCEVYEQTAEGPEIINRTLSGFVHIIRGNE